MDLKKSDPSISIDVLELGHLQFFPYLRRFLQFLRGRVNCHILRSPPAHKVIIEKSRGDVSFHLKYMMVSQVKRFWSYEGRKVGHSAQIQPKSQFLFHKNLPPRDVLIWFSYYEPLHLLEFCFNYFSATTKDRYWEITKVSLQSQAIGYGFTMISKMWISKNLSFCFLGCWGLKVILSPVLYKVGLSAIEL
jgi:hypothetical protein